MLSPLISKIKEKNIIAFDVETTGEENNFLMGSIYGEYKYYRKDKNKEMHYKINKTFWDKKEFLEYILNNGFFYRNCYLVATNLSFDLMSILENTDIISKFKLILRGSNIIFASFKSDYYNKTLKFIDTFNFSKISVKDMGKIIGIPKLPTPICFKRKPKDNTEKIELENYNKRDSLITYEFTKMLQKGFNGLNCNMKLTIASTSMDLFKRNYLDRILVQNKETLPLLYKSYYGARCEILKRGYVEDLMYYDYNNMYGSCFLKEYPNPNYEQYRKKCYLGLIENKNYEGIVKATVKINNIDLPYLPYRDYSSPNSPYNSPYKLIFPIGIFTGYYTFFELRNAMKLGYEILNLGETVYYTEKFKPFEKYIKKIYPLKVKYKKLKSPLAEVYKIVANSLYGKFAQKIDNKEEIYHIDSLTKEEIKNFCENKNKFNSIIRGNYIYVKKKIIPYIPSFVIPIFSIITTAYARDKLYKKIIDIGVDKVYYYDTDSIITSEILSTSDKLGKLKLEYPIYNGILVSPKMYLINSQKNKNIIKIKGVPHRLNDNENLNREKFIQILGNKTIEYEKFVKFKEANSRNLKYNQILEVKKSFSLEDSKREWSKKFNPFELQNSNPIKIYTP